MMSEEGSPPLPIQNGPSQTSADELAAGLSRWIKASESFVYIEVSSIVLLFSCVANWVPWKWHKYALSVACVSLIICILLQTLEFFLPGFLEWQLIKKRDDGTGGHTVSKIASVFLMVWWSFGTGLITFKAPFVETSNGWFAAWAGLLSSVKWCIGLQNNFYGEQTQNTKYIFNLVLCSIILLIASIAPLTQKWPNYGPAGFSIATGAVTIVAAAYLITIYSAISRSVMKVTSIFLFILWTTCAGVVTFHGPFLITNNGYFAAWIGCACTLKLMMLELSDESPETI